MDPVNHCRERRQVRLRELFDLRLVTRIVALAESRAGVRASIFLICANERPSQVPNKEDLRRIYHRTRQSDLQVFDFKSYVLSTFRTDTLRLVQGQRRRDREVLKVRSNYRMIAVQGITKQIDDADTGACPSCSMIASRKNQNKGSLAPVQPVQISRFRCASL